MIVFIKTWTTACFAALILILPSMFPAAANAQSRFCAKRDSMLSALESRYKEQRRGLGLAASAGLVELYLSESGSWTVIVTMANGVSCILAAGKDWEETKIKKVPVGSNT